MESIQEHPHQEGQFMHSDDHLESAGNPNNAFSVMSILKRTITNFDLSKLFENRRILIPCCCDLPLARPLTRVYQVWPGKNVFFFRGRMICGPDPRGFILTTISIVLSDWIFSAYISDASANHSVLISAFSMTLTAIVIVTLVLTGTRDPGIIPRNENSPLEEASTSTGNRSRCINVDGIEMKVKYCRICKVFRPPRSSHCAVCDNCIEKFDHHCPWIGQCIGLRNYRCYLMFISSALAFYVYTLAFSLRRIRMKMDSTGAGVWGLLRFVPETFALAIFSFIAIWFLGCLLAFHFFLVTKNQTSHERYKERYRNSPNPYNKGVLGNIRECLFAKLPPSRVDFRAVVEPNWGTIARTFIVSSPNHNNAEVVPPAMQNSPMCRPKSESPGHTSEGSEEIELK